MTVIFGIHTEYSQHVIRPRHQFLEPVRVLFPEALLEGSY